MKAFPASLLALLLAATTMLPGTASARSSDRNKPMDIEAGYSDYSMDDSRPTVLTGGVTITQGTLDIRANRADITQRNGEAVRAVLTGGPVRLNQQLDDGKPMDAVATKVDYDLRNEVVVFTGDVNISQPSGSISGQRIVYNMRTGQVQGGGEGAGRVKMRIMPRNGGASADPEPASDGDEG
ncbi:lipopolysaccharide transport periplasmic protein LptA [Novilysobacter selenitireducens]|uniref:Lipopolysaccharide export system protein LptA n=1 Tax=Novilysobacter selenitireducens TaxID=2872639 RepID=A0ABS7T6E7_9GAMM|nr:lipopolysaccharide transport periplasmic protein LptA [Lysobacter selenitireducens]MBZ4039456.1 lipopolysaccharide transport periplasmic protein LptA [Lysobacter selenitireducens]